MKAKDLDNNKSVLGGGSGGGGVSVWCVWEGGGGNT